MRVFLFLILAILALVIGLWIAQTDPKEYSVEQVVTEITNRLNTQLKQTNNSLEEITPLFSDTIRWDIPMPESFSTLVYDSGHVVYWSNNNFVPSFALVSDDFSLKFVKTSGGDYLIMKRMLGPTRFIVALINLFKGYPIRNDYLSPRWNKNIFDTDDVEIFEMNASKGTPVCLSGNCLFKVKIPSDGLIVQRTNPYFAVLFISLGIIALIWVGYVLVRKYSSKDFSFLWILVGLWLLRWLMTYFNFPNRIVPFSLFDPQHFASSNLNRSLGDLFLNELALGAIIYFLFRNYSGMKFVQSALRNQNVKVLVGVGFSIVYYFVCLYPFVVIQTLYNNSSIVLDISQSLQFDVFRMLAYCCLILSWCSTFLFAHVIIRFLLSSRKFGFTFLYLVVGGTVFVLVNEFTGQIYFSTLVFGIVYFFIVWFFAFSKSLAKIQYTTFVYFFVAVILLALVGTLTVHHFTRKEKIENQFRFAQNFLVDRDYFAEYLLKEAASGISEDLFIQSRINSPFLTKDAIRQKVRQVFLPNYFNKYDVDILLFGPNGNPIQNRSTGDFSEIMNNYGRDAFKTDYHGVYYINSPEAGVTQRYITVSPLLKNGVSAGFVVLQLLLKRFIPKNVYPELLIDNRFQEFYHIQDLSYAVYGKKLMYSSGMFNYERDFKRELLGNPDIHLRGSIHKGYVHVAVDDGNNRAAVVSSPVTPWVFAMANFSFLMVLGLGLLLFYLLIYGITKLASGRALYFSARIQLVLNLAFFIPLIIVSFTTLRLSNITNLEQLNDEYLNKSGSFGAQVETILDEFQNSADVNRIDFENQLTDLAKLFNLDANVYLPDGKLLASSQPLIFKNGLIAPYMSPEAYQKILRGESLLIETESVGNLDYSVSFASLKSGKTGELIGVLALPFFQSENSLEKIQTRVLANILNIFAGVFIVLIVLSYIVSEWLTFPLRFITQSLSKTTLTHTNQPMIWNAADEIGMMVKEYNQMLYKLGESKAELEKTQRERAWREIAQQVAHEIKNPLTPMKLTLQQLERAVQSGKDNYDRTVKALASLLVQVDTLNEIASSFSSFAKMPEPNIQSINIVVLLKRIVALHSQSGELSFEAPEKKIVVLADEQLVGRIFSNLILNAFQAARSGIRPRVEIKISIVQEGCLIRFEDNGKGIAPKVADRVFVPYFSTKRSGSGLGLAISKQGLEQMGGKIWFESEVGKGTIFFVQLPIQNS